ncbi:hypothetical protein LAZ67_1003377 [Cordylochernes scorpioides]|uniref:Uncharacterized protein n=1 Tax=Cordylochernes scorpioides TaxID=51811 RepID=A0ABY6JZL7_9ARAC|nr:hypothetical protein LAZ67_1003377 [Cordylochernes scorpioides]
MAVHLWSCNQKLKTPEKNKVHKKWKPGMKVLGEGRQRARYRHGRGNSQLEPTEGKGHQMARGGKSQVELEAADQAGQTRLGSILQAASCGRKDVREVSYKQRLVDGKNVLEYPTSSVLWTERTSWSILQAESRGRKGHGKDALDIARAATKWNQAKPATVLHPRLESYYTKLVDLNEKYQALLVVKEGITEESIDREWQECDKYEEEKFDIQQKVSVLRNPDKEETIPIASEDTVINVKLPELALKSYDGSLEEAYRVVASYPVTGANYVLAVQALQERFGDPNILTELHPSSGYGMELAKREESDKGVGGAQERLRLLLDFLKAEVRSAQRLKFVEKGFKQEEPYKRVSAENNWSAKNCGRNHLEVLCEGNSSNRLAKPGRENLKENAPEPIASLSSQACTGQVLLMTTVSTVKRPKCLKKG